MLVNSQLVCLERVGIHNPIMFDLNYFICFMHFLGPTCISITNTATGKKTNCFFRLVTETFIFGTLQNPAGHKKKFSKYRIRGKSLGHQDNIIPSHVKLVESSDSHKTDWHSFSLGLFLFEEKELPVNSNHVRLSGHNIKSSFSSTTCWREWCQTS